MTEECSVRFSQPKKLYAGALLTLLLSASHILLVWCRAVDVLCRSEVEVEC